MTIAHSRLTAQGQISVPKIIRQRLAVGPGAVLEWDIDGERIVVRRAGRHSSEELHQAVFSRQPRAHTTDELKQGVRRHIKQRHAGR